MAQPLNQTLGQCHALLLPHREGGVENLNNAAGNYEFQKTVLVSANIQIHAYSHVRTHTNNTSMTATSDLAILCLPLSFLSLALLLVTAEMDPA